MLAVYAGGRRVIAVVLIVQFIVVRFQPVRLIHGQPGSIGIETKFQHPLRFVTLCGKRAHHLCADAFGKFSSG